MSTAAAPPPASSLLKSAPVSSDYSYDQVLYPNDPFPQTHPDRIATIGTLFGMTPAPVEQCRVLEIGCGRGANIMGMSYSLPSSEFSGVELSKRQNDEASAHADAVGIKNLALRTMSIMDVDESFGE